MSKAPLPGSTSEDTMSSVFWKSFLRDEVPAPTAKYRGRCEVTDATFVQTSEAVDVTVDVPDGLSAADVNVDVSATSWTVSVGRDTVGGDLCGPVKVDSAAWLLDDGGLHVSFEKRHPGTWWPGLTRPAPAPR